MKSTIQVSSTSLHPVAHDRATYRRSHIGEAAVGMLSVLGAVAVISGCATGSSFVRPNYDFSKLGRVAVVTTSPVLEDKQRKEVADLFGMALLKRGFDVIDRANLDEIMGEADFQTESGLTSSEGKAQLAVKNVSAMVVVNVTEFGDKISMTAKMVDVGTGSTLWMGEGTGNMKSGLGTLTGLALGGGAGAVGAHQMDSSRSSTLTGGAAGAVAGGLVGAALEPSQAQMVRKVIDRVTKDMPSLVPVKP